MLDFIHQIGREKLLTLLFMPGVFGVFLYLYYKWKFTDRLRRRAPEIYRSLGRPSAAWKRYYSADEISASMSLAGYILRGEYREIRDAGLRRMAGRLRVLMVLEIVLIGCLMAAVWTTSPARQPREEGGSGRSAETGETETPVLSEAYACYRNGRYHRALELLNHAIGEDPDASAAYFYYRGITLERLNRYDEALNDFETAAARDPGHWDTFVHLDWHFSRRRRWDRVVDYWNLYIAHNPENPRAYLERGGAYWHMGDLDHALEDAGAACRLGDAEGCRRYDQVKRTLETRPG